MEKKKQIKRRIKHSIPFFLMSLPAVVYLFINNYLPMFGLVIAFKKIDYSLGILKSPWNGLNNFAYLFKTSDAWLIVRNTVGYNIIFIVVGLFVSVTVAILLSEITNKFLQQSYQTCILIPYLLSIVMVSYLVFAFLGTESGILNKFRERMGLSKVSWYSTPKYWPFILVLVNTWKGFGYTSIVYFATIMGIDKSLYEAAAVDGATGWKQVRHITLPCLKPTIITLSLLAIGGMFHSDFGLFYQVPMNSGLLQDVTNTIDTYVYRGLVELFDPGRSAAAGFLQSILGFIMVLSANALTRRVERDLALF